MPEYAVRNHETGAVRIVDAKNRANALAHVVASTLSVEIATSVDVFTAAAQGRSLEIAGTAVLPTNDGQQDMLDAINQAKADEDDGGQGASE